MGTKGSSFETLTLANTGSIFLYCNKVRRCLTCNKKAFMVSRSFNNVSAEVIEDSIEALHYCKIVVKSIKKRLKSKLGPIFGIIRDKKNYSTWGLYIDVK